MTDDLAVHDGPPLGVVHQHEGPDRVHRRDGLGAGATSDLGGEGGVARIAAAAIELWPRVGTRIMDKLLKCVLVRSRCWLMACCVALCVITPETVAAAGPTDPRAVLCEDDIGPGTDSAPFMRGFSPPPTRGTRRLL